jgi:hypothetical protein
MCWRGFLFAGMTLDSFRQCSPYVQLYFVLKYGTYLAQRWEADDDGVSLYHMAEPKGRGYFIEVGAADDQGPVMVLRSFESSEPLEDYMLGVQLPE